MYQRIKKIVYSEHREDSDDDDTLEDVKIEQYECVSDDTNISEKDNKKITFSNKVSNIFSYIFKSLP